MNFSKSTQFWFDVTSEQAPKLDSPRMQSQGLTYQFQAPLIVHQWAPTATKYLPYVDFRSQLNGALSTKIEKGAMKLRLEPGRLQIRSNFRSEFSIIRRIRSWISTSILSSRVAEYLREKDFQVEVPAWEIGEDMTLGMSHLKVSGQSLRVLLDFKSNK